MRKADRLPVRLLTHNIRYATERPFPGEALWEIRKSLLIGELRFHTAHCSESFICLQEVLHHQLVDIVSGLNRKAQDWDYVGVGRDDGYQAGEYSPIIYRSSIWNLETQRTVWLSETPDRPSKGWDAASTRILTIAVFQHLSTHKKVVAMNTHLDDQGSRSRLEAVRIILKQIRLFADQVPYIKSPPIFLAGDFNSVPGQEAYQEMVKQGSPMGDIRKMVAEDDCYGDFNTYTGFELPRKPSKRIDFLFANQEGLNLDNDRSSSNKDTEKWWLVESYAVMPNRFEDKIFNSDHQAVIGDMSIV